jgi:hypothetical protein
VCRYGIPFDLLLAVPKIGPVRAGRLLGTARVRQTKTIGSLTDRQRADLIRLLHAESAASSTEP